MKSGLMPYSRTILDKIQSTPALCNNYFVHILHFTCPTIKNLRHVEEDDKKEWGNLLNIWTDGEMVA